MKLVVRFGRVGTDNQVWIHEDGQWEPSKRLSAIRAFVRSPAIRAPRPCGGRMWLRWIFLEPMRIKEQQ